MNKYFLITLFVIFPLNTHANNEYYERTCEIEDRQNHNMLVVEVKREQFEKAITDKIILIKQLHNEAVTEYELPFVYFWEVLGLNHLFPDEKISECCECNNGCQQIPPLVLTKIVGKTNSFANFKWSGSEKFSHSDTTSKRTLKLYNLLGTVTFAPNSINFFFQESKPYLVIEDQTKGKILLDSDILCAASKPHWGFLKSLEDQRKSPNISLLINTVD